MYEPVWQPKERLPFKKEAFEICELMTRNGLCFNIELESGNSSEGLQRAAARWHERRERPAPPTACFHPLQQQKQPNNVAWRRTFVTCMPVVSRPDHCVSNMSESHVSGSQLLVHSI
jgi:hypothetical protein